MPNLWLTYDLCATHIKLKCNLSVVQDTDAMGGLLLEPTATVVYGWNARLMEANAGMNVSLSLPDGSNCSS